MSDLQNRNTSPRSWTVLNKFRNYSQMASEIGHRAREFVFSFRSSPSVEIDYWSLPVKLLHRHRILQRQRVFHQGGGNHSSIIRYALKKARHNR